MSSIPPAPPLSSAPSSEPSRYNVYSQRLNNSAALCIEVGQYERAILSLQRALRLCEAHMAVDANNAASSSLNTPSKACQCRDCTLDGCIAFSEANTLLKARISDNNSESSGNNESTTSLPMPDNISPRSSKRRRVVLAMNAIRGISLPAQNVSSDKDETVRAIPTEVDPRDENDEQQHQRTPTHAAKQDNDEDLPYVYRKPIRVKRQGHEMGSMLFLVILYNLALAHQLKAIEVDEHHNEIAQSVKKAQLLYELIFEYWSRIQNHNPTDNNDNNKTSSSSTYGSIRFSMILYNNLSQMYRLTRNKTKEKQCLQELLSAIMVVTDQRLGSVQQLQRSVVGPNGSSGTANGFSTDLEGFLSNTSRLTANFQCAHAA